MTFLDDAVCGDLAHECGEARGLSRRTILSSALILASAFAVGELASGGGSAQAAIRYSYPTDPFIVSTLAAGQYGAPRKGYTHQGADIWPKARGVDQPVLSVASGVVTYVGPLSSGWGHHVEIRNDDGVRVKYAHFKARPIVSVGARVSAGQRIGTMGGSALGSLTRYGVHLHIEIRPSTTTVSPVPFLRARVS